MKRIGVIAAAVLAAFIGSAAAAEPLATRPEMTPQSASEERPAEIFVRALRAIEAQEEARCWPWSRSGFRRRRCACTMRCSSILRSG